MAGAGGVAGRNEKESGRAPAGPDGAAGAAAGTAAGAGEGVWTAAGAGVARAGDPKRRTGAEAGAGGALGAGREAIASSSTLFALIAMKTPNKISIALQHTHNAEESVGSFRQRRINMNDGMHAAFGISEEDVEAVLKAHALDVVNSRGATFAAMASELLTDLDHGAIERAALYGNDIDEQTRFAHAAIAEQLRGLGALEAPRLEEETFSPTDTMNG